MSQRKPFTKAQKKAYAIAMKDKQQMKPRPSGVNRKYVRPVPQRQRATPLYRPVTMNQSKSVITGSGKYGLRNAGQDIGRGVGHVLERIFGSGDYAIQANSIMGGVYDPPELHNRSDRSNCIRHREYICDIKAASTFTLQSFAINPGLYTSFPWLAQVADSYEEYRFTGIVFEFKTLSADYTTASSAALGYVIMSTQYNVLSPNFPDKITMENYEFSNSAKPSDSFIHPVECKRSLNPVSELFVRSGTPTTGDFRLYDHGNFQIATGGNSGTGTLGELWCTYEVEFYKPKLLGSIGYQLLSDHWYASTGLANATPIGTAALQSGSNIGTTKSGNVISFPPNMQDGYYFINYGYKGSSTAITGFTTTEVNCSVVNRFVNGTVATIQNSGSTDDTYIISFVLQITAQSATFSLNGDGVLPTSPTSMDLWIMQINGAITK